jgi:hypothetical protein
MKIEDVDTWAKSLLLKIHTITGWVIPTGNMLTIIIDQFRKKLVEVYGSCNPDEIDYAFRTFGTGVKDWGKQMNLSLIAEVMSEYLTRRIDVSKHEESIATREKAMKPVDRKEDLSDASMKAWLEDIEKRVSAKEIQIDFMPMMIFDWLCSVGILSADQDNLAPYIEKAAVLRRRTLIKRFNENEKDRTAKKELSDFLDMIKQGYFTGSEITIVTNLAKRVMLYEHINQQYVDRPMPEVQEGLGDVPGPAGVDDGSGDSNGGEVHHDPSVQPDGLGEETTSDGEPAS